MTTLAILGTEDRTKTDIFSPVWLPSITSTHYLSMRKCPSRRLSIFLSHLLNLRYTSNPKTATPTFLLRYSNAWTQSQTQSSSFLAGGLHLESSTAVRNKNWAPPKWEGHPPFISDVSCVTEHKTCSPRFHLWPKLRTCARYIFIITKYRFQVRLVAKSVFGTG